MKRLFLLSLLLFTFSLSAQVVADDMTDMAAMSDKLKVVNKKLSRGDFEGDDLVKWTKLSIKMKSSASLCVSNSEAALLDLKSVIEGLGEAVKGEDAEVTKKRKAYEKEKEELDKTLAKCNLYIASSTEVANLISDAEKSYFKQKYLVRSPHIIDLVVTYLKDPFAILQGSGEFVIKKSGIREIDALDVLLSIVAVVVSVLIGIWLRRKLLRLESRHHWKDDFSENLARALLTTLSCSMPYLLGSLVAAIISVVITMEVEETPFITELFIGLLIFFLATTTIRLLFSPYPPAKRFISFSPHIAEALARRLRVLAILGLLGYLAFYTVFSESIIESNLLLMRNIYSLFIVLNLVWTLQVIIASPKLPKLRYLSMLVIVAVLASLAAEWMGYRNLAFSSRRIIVLSFVAFMIFIGVAKIFRDLYDAVDAGSYSWCRRLHDTLGVEHGQKVPGLIWIRLTTTILIWGSFTALLIYSWDYSGGMIEQIRSYVVNGFDIGNFRIVPGRILWALLIFGSIVILSSWVRSQMENQWLKMTTMGQGARDAMVTITGYIMFLIALLAGMSAAGFDFGNIAIIAGALSVGIGFGLQNIVNNFVSGLILLFERPVRKGDWVVVNGTEGVVKDIQIRSTRIETFDRSDVIVPNSELISNQVTNWVLSSSSGRAVIPVGVAYGTDTELVRDTLLKVAEESDDIAKTSYLPKPIVLFREFGDSSLNFELRVFLHNVDSRLSVISDLNFAIDKAFREAGIEIPFPQRDLHVRSLPDNFDQNNDKERES
ncbi:MAG: mechanosensitive ion channel [Gammaproteobacteria bacterium]|nr:mechanosensitive ion channel [Gammaproteobacteria bacterium]NNJ49940.1 mechanosensitive ion channel family protein [Gammaproteobacteria bacterium]